ncbi:hypothetical protein ACH677_16870 [Klebsiella aerogenes]|uniref:hypothetical protein n=1 Tax=Klebsiella aerogenes TaxID=548 RepID=UPI0037B028A3
MDKCQGIFGKIFGHSFRVAITKGAPAMNLKSAEADISSIMQMMEASRPETYHGIYCKRCGKVIDDAERGVK